MWRKVVPGVVLLLLAVSALSSAEEWSVEVGADGQMGHYEFSAVDPEYTFDFSVAMPRVRYQIAALSSRGTRLAGYLASGETDDATMDRAFRAMGHGKYSGEAYGRTREVGAEVSQEVRLGSIQLEPSLGYHELEFLTGARNPEDFDYDHDNRVDTYAFGLATKGMRLGLSATLPIGDRCSLNLEGGLEPNLTVSELRQVSDAETPLAMGNEESLDWRTPHSQSSHGSDISADLVYRFSERLSATVGYKVQHGDFDFDLSEPLPKAKCMADLYTFRAEAFSVGLNYRF